ncbi:hypothetical protein [Xanthobacter sp.]|uniref:hypothetical protein n=1 Tax=Xanthobacter sp. TaxID=35809 RepID=UPI0025FB86AC|nr:hypothetical protein [Xanthobacter sp.]
MPITLTLILQPGSLPLAIGGPRPPAGFVFITDTDGSFLMDSDGAYLVEPA